MKSNKSYYKPQPVEILSKLTTESQEFEMHKTI